MQKRHRHFIRKTSRVTYPQCIVAVEAAGHPCYGYAHDDSGAICLDNWSASVATLKHGCPSRQSRVRGNDAVGWWCELDNILSHHQNTWVVSWNALDVMTLLDLWTELEERRAYLVRSDPRAADKRAGKRGARSAGYFVCENPPTIVCFKRRNLPGTVTWLDMRNYGLSGSIESGKSYSSPQQTLGTLLDIIEFLRTSRLGSLRATVGSQSLSSFKYRYLKHSIHVSTIKSQTDISNDALIGGRCECFRMGAVRGPVTQFDVNSLYPSVYSRRAVPIRCRGQTSNPSDSDIASALRGKNCIARIMVETDTPNVPKRDGRGTYFPIGRIATTVCWPELEVILDTCRTIKFVEIATYDCEQVLAEYGRELYSQREYARSSGNGPREVFAKSMLVSITGKFSQRLKCWQIAKNQVCPGPWRTWHKSDGRGGVKRFRSVGWDVEEEVNLGLGYESVPEISAWINSWGRRILWELINHAGRENVYYCATDAIWCGEQGAERIRCCGVQIGSGMGGLRRVNQYNAVEFRGQGHYVADGEEVCAGQKRANNANGGGIPADLEIEGPSAAISRGRKPGIIVKRIHGERMQAYRLGRIQPDLSVLPLICEDW